MQVNKAIDNARYLAEQVKKRDGFELLIEPEFTNCCFWYYPKCLREFITPDPSRLTKVTIHVTIMVVVRKGNVNVTGYLK